MRRNKKKNKLTHIRATKNKTELRNLRKEKKAEERKNRCYLSITPLGNERGMSREGHGQQVDKEA